MSNTDIEYVSKLSDDELREQLQLHSIDCGPILPSTRRVYEKKLLRILDSEGSADVSQVSDKLEYSQSYDEEPPIQEVNYTEYVREESKYSDPVVSENIFTERDDPIRHRVFNDTPESPFSYSRASRYTSSLPASRPSAMSTLLEARQSRTSELVTQAKPPESKQKKRGLSIWVQLIIVVVIALIIFMVFQNMEPANKPPTYNIGKTN